MDKQDDVADFLGFSILRRDDGTILMTQSGLATKIVDVLVIEKMPCKFTPEEPIVLIKDKNGELPTFKYNYAGIFGMLQYFQGHSLPDITFAVSQVSRYTYSPKRLHELALERIG